MLIDRVVTDMLGLINRLLFWRAKEVDERPFIPIGTPVKGALGILAHVQWNSPTEQVIRQVSYYIFMPYAVKSKGESVTGRNMIRKDVHICCSFLGAVARNDRIHSGKVTAKKRSRAYSATDPTHRIDILLAPHFIGKSRMWEPQQIYSGEHDLQGNQSDRDRFASGITLSIAARLCTGFWDQIRWDEAIELARKEVMGSCYTGRKRASLSDSTQWLN